MLKSKAAQFIHDMSGALATVELLADSLEHGLKQELNTESADAGKQVATDIDELSPDQQLHYAAQQIKLVTQSMKQQLSAYSASVISGLAQDLPSVSDVLPKHAAIVFDENLRILVAEDEKMFQLLVKKKLVNYPHTVVKNGQEAIDAVKACAGTDQAYQLVLMDLQMPVCDGITAVQTIQSLPIDDKPIIVGLSNQPLTEAEKANLLQQGFYSFIHKPLDIDELRQLFS